MREDLGALILYLLYKHRHGNQTYKLSPKAQEALLHYSYPGNFRELENILERAVALTVGQVIQVDDLQIQNAPQVKAERSGFSLTILPNLTRAKLRSITAPFHRLIRVPCRYRITSIKWSAASSSSFAANPLQPYPSRQTFGHQLPLYALPHGTLGHQLKRSDGLSFQGRLKHGHHVQDLF